MHTCVYFSNCCFFRWADVTLSQSILELLFPGKVTAVFKRKKSLNVSLNPYTSLIGIRIPNNDFIRELVRRCQYPIALTSANKSGATSTLQIEVRFRKVVNLVFMNLFSCKFGLFYQIFFIYYFMSANSQFPRLPCCHSLILYRHHTAFCIITHYCINSTLCNRPIEKYMGLIALYIEIARGK